MAKTDMDVGTGLVGAPACGDVMKLSIKVNKRTNIIEDVKFKTFGCGSAIASSSYLTEVSEHGVHAGTGMMRRRPPSVEKAPYHYC